MSHVLASTGPTPLVFSMNASYSMSPAFWGANVRGYSALGSEQVTQWKATPLSYAMFPGGRAGDGYDYIHNILYSDTGSKFSPPVSVASFASWCKSVGCGAIMQLPGRDG